MASPLLEVQGLEKRFAIGGAWLRGRRRVIRAVDGVSFTIERGEVLGLVGESGCGKSTTGRLILRLIEPSAGRIRFEGHELTTLSPARLWATRQRMQIVFQDPFASLNPRMRVGRIIAEPLAIYERADAAERRRQVTELLNVVGLDPAFADRYPHELSGGQRQRIGIAAALALRPSLIVADEPVSALDVSVQAQVLNLLMDLRRRFGLTYLFISHDLHVVLHMSDRVAVMYLGEIVEIGPREAVHRDPKHPYTQVLLAAAPVADPTLRRERMVPRGEVAGPLAVPSGCRFHPRCPFVFDRCRVEKPVLRTVGAGHEAACHLNDPRPVPSRVSRGAGPE
jgi:oligopeptide transport system ATP-binding protein